MNHQHKRRPPLSKKKIKIAEPLNILFAIVQTRLLGLLLVFWISCFSFAAHFSSQTNTPVNQANSNKRSVMIIWDGVRSQEIFKGTDETLQQGPRKSAQEYLPFLYRKWLMDPHSKFFSGESCRINNPAGLSLPAYADLLAGVRQEAVLNNKFNGRLGQLTALDRLLLQGIPASQISVITSWQRIKYVTSQKLGSQGFRNSHGIITSENPPWHDAAFDADTFGILMEQIRKPDFDFRYLVIAFNDADEYGHRADYPAYLRSLQTFDSYLQKIFEYFQSQPQFANNISYLLTTDHGRGYRGQWASHNSEIEGSEKIWAIGYDPSLKPAPLIDFNLGFWDWQARILPQTQNNFPNVCDHINWSNWIERQIFNVF